MKKLKFPISTLLVLLLMLFTACEPGVNTLKLSGNTKETQKSYPGYEPTSTQILPLTEFTDDSKINVFVSLEDNFASALKAPAVFRFELYNRLPRSADPKGARVNIWPDINLTDVRNNNEHWKDFLRAYEFNINFQPDKDKHYILQVTAFCEGGKRLTAEYVLK